jgi:hypothetical protein
MKFTSKRRSAKCAPGVTALFASVHLSVVGTHRASGRTLLHIGFQGYADIENRTGSMFYEYSAWTTGGLFIAPATASTGLRG